MSATVLIGNCLVACEIETDQTDYLNLTPLNLMISNANPGKALWALELGRWAGIPAVGRQTFHQFCGAALALSASHVQRSMPSKPIQESGIAKVGAD